MNSTPSRMLRLPEVIARTGRGKSSIYADIKKGTFPKRVLIGPRSVAWLESEVESWIRSHFQIARLFDEK